MINTKFKLAAIGLMALFVACSSTEKKTEEPAKPVVVEPPKKEEPMPVVASRSVDTGTAVEASNEKLAKVPMLGLPAFGKGKQIDASGKEALDAAKAAVADLPEGYVLQITGHHNPHPDKSQRKGNGLSVQRAKMVYDYFVKNGIPKEKLSYRGVGSAEYDKSLSHDNNRRVTFKIVKASEADAAPEAAKPNSKPKPEVKPVAKPEVKPEPKPAEAKPEAKPADVKPEVKPEAAVPAEVKPAEVKPGAKP